MTLLERYKEFGESFDPQTINIPACLRVNTLKIAEEELVERLTEKGVTLKKVSFLDNAYYFEAPFSLSSMEEYLLGYFYIQEAASQLPVKVIQNKLSDFSSPIHCLDMCAAPGSKTTQLAQVLGDKEIIIATDNHVQRLKTLQFNVERLGLQSIALFKKDARYVDDLKKQFDIILLDAPCSGNFCVEENFFRERTLVDVKDKSRTQKEMLKAAYKVLKKGGLLLYSTCSLEPEEDELVVDWFLKKYEDIKLQETNLELGDKGLVSVLGQELDQSIKLTKRFWPHKTNTQGFYLALFKKT